MRKTHSAGGVVVNKGKVAIVSQRGRSWSLPKGHIDAGEDKLEAAKREIQEETGISELNLIEELGTYQREKMESEDVDGLPEMKVMTFFLFTTSQNKLETHDANNPEARWVSPDEAERMLTDPKDKEFFRKVRSKIKV